MSTPDQWARFLGEKLRTRQQRFSAPARDAELNGELLAEQMPHVWDDLCREFQEHCQAFNRSANFDHKLGFFRIGVRDFIVRPDALEEIVRGHYEFNTKAISITTQKGTEWYFPSTDPTGTEQIHLMATNKKISLAFIAQATIAEAVLRFPSHWLYNG